MWRCHAIQRRYQARLINESIAHGHKVEFNQKRLAPPKALEGLSEEQKALHDDGLEQAKRRVMERVQRRNGQQ